MDEEQKRKVIEILVSHSDLFTSSNPGTTDLVSHQIDTGLNYPTHSAPCRTSLKERIIIQNEVEKMKETNIIRESKSPWAAPVVLVSKKMSVYDFVKIIVNRILLPQRMFTPFLG